MRLEEFLLSLFDSWQLYLVALFLSGVLVILLFRRYVKSVFDPFCYQLLGTFFANAIPIYLFISNQISFENFFFFVLIELSFWIGFCKYKPKSNIILKSKPRYKGTFTLFVVSSFFVIATQLYFYSVQGLPILMESRLEKYSGAAPGLGILERLIYVMSPYSIIYSLAHFKSINKKKRIASRFFLLFILFTCIVGGSKSAILTLLGPLYFYLSFLSRFKIKIKHVFLLGGVGLCMALGIIIISSDKGGNGTPALLQLGYRIIMYGDCYYEAYPYNDISYVTIKNPLQLLFSNLLAPFRLMSYSSVADTVPTLQIHYNVYPELTTLSGPNNRVPILFYSLFKSLGFVVSYIVGRWSSYFLYGLTKRVNKDIIGISIYCALYQAVVVVITDPLLTMSYMASFIFGLLFFKIIYNFIKTYLST